MKRQFKVSHMALMQDRQVSLAEVLSYLETLATFARETNRGSDARCLEGAATAIKFRFQ